MVGNNNIIYECIQISPIIVISVKRNISHIWVADHNIRLILAHPNVFKTVVSPDPLLVMRANLCTSIVELRVGTPIGDYLLPVVTGEVEL